jgi:hypothetical protein
MNDAFDAEEPAPETVSSMIIIQEYPEDCDIYSDTIEASLQSLLTYKNDVEKCDTFNLWAQTMYDSQLATLQDSICMEKVMTLENEAMTLSMMTSEAASEAASNIDALRATGFLANPDMLEGDAFIEMVLTPELVAQI